MSNPEEVLGEKVLARYKNSEDILNTSLGKLMKVFGVDSSHSSGPKTLTSKIS